MQINHATREGVRYAATLSSTEPSWFDAAIGRTHQASAGQLPLADASVRICVSRELGGVAQRKAVQGPQPDLATALAAAGAPVAGHCDADGMTGDRVQVRVQRDAAFDAVFVRMTPTLRADGLARYEDGS